MKKIFINMISFLTARRTLWRLGRALYLRARADVTNNMDENGEKKVQYRILHSLAKTDENIVFFDVGANIGNWTLSVLDTAIKLGIDKRLGIHLFEPAPDTFKALQDRVKKHQLSGRSIHLENRALSSTEGPAEMFIVGENAGTNSLHQDAMNPRAHPVAIEKTTGDKYCALKEIEKIHFMKCDTEGHDVEVLFGIGGLIASEKIMVFQFEYTYRWIYSRHYLKDVFDFIGTRNYKIAKITPDKIEIYEGWHPELEKFFEGNYLLIHENALAWFDLTLGKFDVFGTYGV